MILGFTPPGGVRLGADDADADGYDDVTGEWIDYTSGTDYTDPTTGSPTGDLDGDAYDDGSGEWLGMPGDTGYDPWLDASPDQDSDGDGINDFDEVFGFSIERVITTDGTQTVEYFDPDTGEIIYVEEFTTTTEILSEWITTDPTRPDSDYDGLPDGWERDMGFHPGQPEDGWADTDGDGLANGLEYPLGTGIWNPDSDGDDLNDGDEVILFGSDPLDPADPGETEGEEDPTEGDDGTNAMGGGDDSAESGPGDTGDGGADDSQGAGNDATNDTAESNPEPPTEPEASPQTPSAGAPSLLARAVIYSGGAPPVQPDGSGHVLPGDDPTSGGGDGGLPATAYVTTKTWIPQTITIETVAEVESRHWNVPPSPYDYDLPELGGPMSIGSRAGLVGDKLSATAGAHLHAMGEVYPQGQRAEVWLRMAEAPTAPVSRTYLIEATRTTTLDPNSPPDGTPMHLASPQTHREYGTVTFTIDPANHGTESSITTLRAPGGFAEDWVRTNSGGSLMLEPPLESPYLEGDAYVGGANHSIKLLPVEVAPNVLRANTDFDEGKIDSATGFAIPDSTEDSEVNASLAAQRDSPFDSNIKAGDIVTEDLHQGFFGIRPSVLESSFFDGCEVTITRILKIDEDTGSEQTGKVRFHVTKEADGGNLQHWNVPIHNGQTGSPRDLVPLLYSDSSQIPKDGVKYWIEGVTAGKITLEFRIAKDGSELLRHEQNFEVFTEQTRAEWQDEIRDQILLQTSGFVDLSKFGPTKGFPANVAIIKQIYGYYAQLFEENQEQLMWAGMAKLAGAPVFAGLGDAQYGLDLDFEIPLAEAVANKLLSILSVREFQTQLMIGNKLIFEDLGWQHRAYVASGVKALEYVNREDPAIGVLPVDTEAWEQIDEGIRINNLEIVNAGSLILLRREQEFIIQPVYDAISLINIPSALGYDDALSWLAENPIPRGRPFSELVVGNLAVFGDRWGWIHEPGGTEGMFQIWGGTPPKGLIPSERLSEVQRDLSTRAAADFANFPSHVP